jgi:phosphate transport system permease protein
MMAIKIPSRKRKLQRIFEGGIKSALFACALVSVVALVVVFLFLLWDSLPFLSWVDIWQFLTGTRWAPVGTFPSWGVVPLLVGTLLVSFVGALISIPIGIGCTIYISEIASPQVKKFLKPAIEILAGVPSVVYGLFAALVLSNWIMDIFHPLTRLNALNGAIILAVMMVPIQISISEEALNAVPSNIREASYALGATKWETIRRVIVPSALPGIIAAIALAIGRAVGETMAVIMATGNSSALTFDILRSVRTMTAALALELPESSIGSLHYSSLFAVGLLLFIITFVINMFADFILARYKEAYR